MNTTARGKRKWNGLLQVGVWGKYFKTLPYFYLHQKSLCSICYSSNVVSLLYMLFMYWRINYLKDSQSSLFSFVMLHFCFMESCLSRFNTHFASYGVLLSYNHPYFLPWKNIKGRVILKHVSFVLFGFYAHTYIFPFRSFRRLHSPFAHTLFRERHFQA